MYIELDMMTSSLYIENMSNEAIGNHVRRHRRLADLTQAQLAKAVEVSRQTVVSIEGGDYSPSVYLALRIAATLDTTVENLFGDGDNHTSSPATTSTAR